MYPYLHYSSNIWSCLRWSPVINNPYLCHTQTHEHAKTDRRNEHKYQVREAEHNKKKPKRNETNKIETDETLNGQANKLTEQHQPTNQRARKRKKQKKNCSRRNERPNRKERPNRRPRQPTRQQGHANHLGADRAFVHRFLSATA